MRELAKAVDKAPSTVNSWELDPQPPDARTLAGIARQHGRYDLEHAFFELAGDEKRNKYSLDTDNLTGDEYRLAEWILKIYRQPENEAQRSVVQLLWSLFKQETGLAQKKSVRKGDSIDASLENLNEEELDLLKKLLSMDDVFRIIRNLVGAEQNIDKLPQGHPARKKQGERMAKNS